MLNIFIIGTENRRLFVAFQIVAIIHFNSIVYITLDSLVLNTFTVDVQNEPFEKGKLVSDMGLIEEHCDNIR